MHRLLQGWRVATAVWRVLRVLSHEREVVAVPGVAALAVAAVAVLLLGGASLWLVLVVAASLVGGAVALASRLGAAPARARRLLGWAVGAAVVSTVCDRLEERRGPGGRVVSSIAGGTFRAVSFLALPVVAFRGVPPVERITRSARLVRAIR